MEFLDFDIESFDFKEIKNNKIMAKTFLKKVNSTVKTNNISSTVFNFRLVNISFPLPFSKITIEKFEAYKETGKLLDLEGNAEVILSTNLTSYKTYKMLEFNTSIPLTDAEIILTEANSLKLFFSFIDILGNKTTVESIIFFKELPLKKEIKYRKVSKCITKVVAFSS